MPWIQATPMAFICGYDAPPRIDAVAHTPLAEAPIFGEGTKYAMHTAVAFVYEHVIQQAANERATERRNVQMADWTLSRIGNKVRGFSPATRQGLRSKRYCAHAKHVKRVVWNHHRANDYYKCIRPRLHRQSRFQDEEVEQEAESRHDETEHRSSAVKPMADRADAKGG